MFVTFEGLDGSGKSTQAKLLAEALAADGREVIATREPGGTELGEHVRELLLAEGEVAPWAEAALFAAARAQLVEDVIAPALERGADVICDRYLDSSLAYQGIARELGLDRVLELNLHAVRGVLPDRTFLLLVDPAESARRVGSDGDRIEREDDDFPRAGRLRLPAAGRGLPGADPDDRRHAPAARDRGGGAPRASTAFLSRRRRSGSCARLSPKGPAHAYLFHGPAGVGKRATALAFASELLGGDPRVGRRSHPDLYVLEPLGDQIRIDAVREMRRDLHMRPFEAQRRVYLVFGAHLLNDEAADALLKDLEEPPEYAVIVARRGRGRAAAGDDPLALPGDPVPAPVRARGARAGAREGAAALRAGGDLDRPRGERPARPRGAPARSRRPRSDARRCSRPRAPSTRRVRRRRRRRASWSRPRASARPRPRSARRRRSKGST